MTEEEVCPVIALPDSWDEYTGMLAPRDERDLRRKIRKANMEAGLEYERTESADTLASDLEDFITLHALSQPEKADFWNADRRAFFEDVTRAMLELGCLELSIMRVDGHPVAANLSFDYGRQDLPLQLGLRPGGARAERGSGAARPQRGGGDSGGALQLRPLAGR